MPREKRVELLAEIAEQKDNLFARFKALQRADALDGIITEGERLKIERQSEQPANQPLFVFSQGVNIQFGPTTISRDGDQSREADVRNVTEPAADNGATD